MDDGTRVHCCGQKDAFVSTSRYRRGGSTSQTATPLTKRPLRLGTQLHHAVESRELTLHYRPQFEVHGGRACGAEALARLGCLQVQGYLLAWPGPQRYMQALLVRRWGMRQ
jgi:hypothetical protein